MHDLKGHCLCNETTFTAKVPKLEMGACHCAMCRRWTAGSYLAVTCDSITFANDSPLGIYESSDWGQRVFCKSCGTILAWQMKNGGHNGVSAQAFDDPSVFAFTSEIFVDEQPANYQFAGDRNRMTGAELIAAFASPEDGTK